MRQTAITLSRVTLVVCLFLTVNASAQTAADGLNDTSLPTLQGEKAVEKLKETGQYDSLREAYNAAREKDGQAAEPQVDDAVGQSAKLTASDGATSDPFGFSVAISGETAIVGALVDDAPSTDSGSAYIFVRSGTVWSQQQKLTASDAAANDQFGFSVAISGETAIVGSITDDDAGTNSGSAYIFVRSGTVWTEQAKLTASDAATSDFFGVSVGISGNTAIVGATGDDDAGLASGSAYIFVRTGTVWTQQAKLTASDGAANDNFGVSVGISGETVIVGAYLDDDAGSASGSAYIFVRSGTVWSQQQKLTASDAAASDQFGISVGISGDKIVVGSPFSDVAAPPLADPKKPLAPQATDQGGAYFFINAFAPTAAGVSVSGRVLSSRGTAIPQAIVVMTDGSGEVRTARVNQFGNYTFGDVEAGQTYVFDVRAKGYSFVTQVRTIDDDLSGFDIMAQ